MTVSRESIEAALRQVRYPGFARDIVSLGLVQGIRLDGDSVLITLDLGPGPAAVGPLLRRDVEERVAGVAGIAGVKVSVRSSAAAAADGLNVVGQRPSTARAGSAEADLLPDVTDVLAVASGKGGVGKSTVAVNLAVALARAGDRVGLLDADIYGPSIPLMTGVDEPPQMTRQRRLVPFERYGIRLMSLGFLVDPASAVIWRGPMVMKAIEQLLRDVEWGPLDRLVVDLPPGTGDAQLTLAQKVQLTGAVIVTTPQDVALADARKGVAMFQKVGVPLLGIVENMSYFVCPHCAERSDVFGHGGGRAEAERLGVPFLGEVPLHPRIRASGDEGSPVAAEDDVPGSREFADIAARIRAQLAEPDSRKGTVFSRFRKLFDPEG